MHGLVGLVLVILIVVPCVATVWLVATWHVRNRREPTSETRRAGQGSPRDYPFEPRFLTDLTVTPPISAAPTARLRLITGIAAVHGTELKW